jgi:hypothetical protein
VELENFVVAAWRIPHRGEGDLVEIDADYARDGLESAAVQSLKELPERKNPELDLNRPHRKFRVSMEQLQMLARLCDETEFSFKEQAFSPQFGGTRYGVRVQRGMQVAQVSWEPRFEDQAAGIRNLHAAIYRLAEA